MKESLILMTTIIIAFLIGLVIPSPFSFQKTTATPTGIANPDMNFPKNGSCLSVARYWRSNGYCYAGTIDGETGVIVIHPLTRTMGRFISQQFIMPSDARILKIKVANVAGKTPWDTKPCPICDSGVRIDLTDLTNWSEHPLDDFIVTAKDGWIVKSYNISQFAGKPVILSIYSYAGGTNLWNGEWTAVSSVTIE